MPPLPIWPSSLYLPRRKPLCLPASNLSACHRVMRLSAISRSASRFWSSSAVSPCSAETFSRNDVSLASSTRLLRRNRSTNLLVVTLVIAVKSYKEHWSLGGIDTADKRPCSRSLAVGAVRQRGVVASFFFACSAGILPQPSQPRTWPTKNKYKVRNASLVA